ncbi:MAG TPA: lactate racemase domain-containing protein [Isosphaeraceae bacterium]|jgi:hypothetical protein|nr:lactate racemase domain-containing protein [Isosphaeraceae bacterium]
MRVAVRFDDERLELEVPDDRLVGAWDGPGATDPAEVGPLVRAAIEHPRDYPPLRRAVVPGDRVVLAVDPEVPEVPTVLGAICEALFEAGVEPEGVRVIASGPIALAEGRLPAGVSWSVHDPEERSRIAYLASTPEGRRIYLDRDVTDADCVVPVGRLGYDPVLGYRGPWGVLFPGLSDAETQRAERAQARDDTPDRDRERPALRESAAVSWLLGSQFHIGVTTGSGGVSGVLAGLETTVRAEGMAAVDAAWTFRPEGRASLVVAGIGSPGRPTGLDDLAEGLATASRLVRGGGKIVLLSRASGEPGPALSRLRGADDPRAFSAALRAAEGEVDSPAARRLASSLARADVYLLSALADDLVDDLGMIPLARPAEALRLVASSDSCLFVSQADRTRAVVLDEEEAT